jgi:hypothetical protein
MFYNAADPLNVEVGTLTNRTDRFFLVFKKP